MKSCLYLIGLVLWPFVQASKDLEGLRNDRTGQETVYSSDVGVTNHWGMNVCLEYVLSRTMLDDVMLDHIYCIG